MTKNLHRLSETLQEPNPSNCWHRSHLALGGSNRKYNKSYSELLLTQMWFLVFRTFGALNTDSLRTEPVCFVSCVVAIVWGMLLCTDYHNHVLYLFSVWSKLLLILLEQMWFVHLPFNLTICRKTQCKFWLVIAPDLAEDHIHPFKASLT